MASLEKVVAVGINHMSAPVGRREALAVLPERLADTLLALKSCARLSEVVVLSTCSRIEIYAVSEAPAFSQEELVCHFRRKGGAQAVEDLWLRVGDQALRHLFRVASGLDSWIIGETEVLAQVKQAYQAAFSRGFTGAVLNRAFQRALNAGKLVRSSTGLQNGIHSIGGAAAVLAGRIFGQVPSGRVVLFGAGAVGETVARHLAAKNFREVLVANRTLEKARTLAGQLGGTAISFQAGLDALDGAEAGIFSTSSPEPVLRPPHLARLIAGRRRSLFLIDLGLPRNVDPACGAQDGVFLYNLDDLKGVVAESMASKARAREQGEVLADEAAAECAAEIEKAGRLRATAGRLS